RTAEVRRAVDGVDASRARGRERRPVVAREEELGLGGCALHAEAIWHEHDEIGIRVAKLRELDLSRALARAAEDVLATRQCDLLRHPVTAVEQRIEPLQTRDAGTRHPVDSAADRFEADPKRRGEGRATLLDAECHG